MIIDPSAIRARYCTQTGYEVMVGVPSPSPTSWNSMSFAKKVFAAKYITRNVIILSSRCLDFGP